MQAGWLHGGGCRRQRTSPAQENGLLASFPRSAFTMPVLPALHIAHRKPAPWQSLACQAPATVRPQHRGCEELPTARLRRQSRWCTEVVPQLAGAAASEAPQRPINAARPPAAHRSSTHAQRVHCLGKAQEGVLAAEVAILELVKLPLQRVAMLQQSRCPAWPQCDRNVPAAAGAAGGGKSLFLRPEGHRGAVPCGIAVEQASALSPGRGGSETRHQAEW
mmetsp:Transcript_35066/g.90094  ORF Transcript_35066/g.90094 Transcript_35066/m.90094 type:complete len:220 (-) Transcript_35066:76-735(-)